MTQMEEELAAQEECASSTLRSPKTEPGRVEQNESHSTPTSQTLQREMRRPADALGLLDSGTQNRPRQDPADFPVQGTIERPDPVAYWTRERQWPREFFKVDVNDMPARRILPPEPAMSTTPSEKSSPYARTNYPLLLETRGCFINESKQGITETSKKICRDLLGTIQITPRDSLFRCDVFRSTCQRMTGENEAVIKRDITPLIVPSPIILSSFGAKHLDVLGETVNSSWESSIPFIDARPQPDYSVGFQRKAFTNDQLAKLSPFLGNYIDGEPSFFMATPRVFFPFFSSEVECKGLEIADRQNANSMTIAVRAVVVLFRQVRREEELHRQILAFSMSHDDRSVHLYGHYAEIDGEEIQYYRYEIRMFFFTARDGKEKWTAYQFTRNIWDMWMPMHLKRIRSAIDQLPSPAG